VVKIRVQRPDPLEHPPRRSPANEGTHAVFVRCVDARSV